MDLAVLVLLKFFMYAAVMAAAVPVLRLHITDRRPFVIKWAAVRLGMGLLFGFVIAALYVAAGARFESDALTYTMSFVPVRIVEWSLVLLLLHLTYKVQSRSRALCFVVLGLSANTSFDLLAVAAGVDNLKFVC